VEPELEPQLTPEPDSSSPTPELKPSQPEPLDQTGGETSALPIQVFYAVAAIGAITVLAVALFALRKPRK